MTRLALTNGRVVLPHRIVENGSVLVEDRQVVAVVSETDFAPAEGWTLVDVANRLVTPGLVDIHVHGASGHTFNEPNVEAYGAILAEHARQGVTSLLATTATAPIDALIECLDFIQEWRSTNHPGAEVLGAHVEGPYFSVAQAGAQDPAHIRTPDDGSPQQLLAHADCIKLFSCAPELPGCLSLIRELRQLGIRVAAGHSNATEEALQPAIDAGLSHMIHIWSGQSSTVRSGPWRKPGLLEVTLTYDTLTAEMIADNRHLPPTLMKLAYRCLGPDRLCLVSDATSGAGLAQGSRYRMGNLEYEVHDGVGMLLDHTAFAGSTTLLNQMVNVLVNVVDVPLIEAVRMASLTPARIIGVDGHKGSLQPGKDADIAIFEEDFRAWGVLRCGRWTVKPDVADLA